MPFSFWPLPSVLSFALSMQNCVLLVVETLHFLNMWYAVLISAALKARQCVKEFLHKLCPCCLPGQRERRGKSNISSGFIHLVLGWSKTSDAFSGSRPWKSYPKYRKERFLRKSDFSLKSFLKCSVWTDLPQEEEPWWALGVMGIYFKGPGKQASEMM